MWEITPAGFIEVYLTDAMRAEAQKRNDDFFRRCGHSGTHRTNKRQRMTGYLAESAVKHVFPNLSYSDDPKVDFVFANKTFDSKSQGCNGEPAPNFAATLYKEQATREVDFLIFSRTQNDSRKVWICGFMGKSKYLERAEFCPVGTVRNNFIYDQARYELKYRDLINPQKFLNVLTYPQKICDTH